MITDDDPDTGILISRIVVALGVVLVGLLILIVVLWVRSIPAPVCCPPPPPTAGVLTPGP